MAARSRKLALVVMYSVLIAIQSVMVLTSYSDVFPALLGPATDEEIPHAQAHKRAAPNVFPFALRPTA